jgi:hypothetical protein
MKQKLLFLLLGFFLLLLGYGLYLLNVIKTSPDTDLNTVIRPKITDVPGGEVIVEKLEKSPVVPFDRVSLNLLTLKNYRTYISQDGNTPAVDLELEYNQGAVGSFTLTIKGNLYYGEFEGKNVGDYKYNDKGLVDLTTINLEKGDLLGVVLAYVPVESGSKNEELGGYCKLEANDPVCQYVSEGFGLNPVEEDQVIPKNNKIYHTSETVVWSLKKELR